MRHKAWYITSIQNVSADWWVLVGNWATTIMCNNLNDWDILPVITNHITDVSNPVQPSGVSARLPYLNSVPEESRFDPGQTWLRDGSPLPFHSFYQVQSVFPSGSTTHTFFKLVQASATCTRTRTTDAKKEKKEESLSQPISAPRVPWHTYLLPNFPWTNRRSWRSIGLLDGWSTWLINVLFLPSQKTARTILKEAWVPT